MFNTEIKVRHYFKKNLVRLLVQDGRGEGCVEDVGSSPPVAAEQPLMGEHGAHQKDSPRAGTKKPQGSGGSGASAGK